MAIYHIFLRMSNETSSPRVFRLPFGLYAKYGPFVPAAEPFATQYVSLNTTIPTPTVLDICKDSDGIFFLMTKVPGRSFSADGVTLHSMTDEQVFVFGETLRGWFAQLRALPPPSDGRVSGFMGASFRCARVDLFGHIDPFESVDAFHEQFFCTLPSISDATMQSLATRTRAKKYRLCFSHCDIRPQNILVDDNQRPVGLIDWDSAAWMPEYWEFTAAVHKRLIYEPWVDTFKRTFLQYKDELTLEIELWKTVSPY